MPESEAQGTPPTPPPVPSLPSHAGIVAARIAAAAALLAAALLVLRPFLASLAWGAILAYVTWPLYRRTRLRERWPGLTAALFTVALAVGIGVPVAFLAATLADEVTGLTRSLLEWQRQGAPLPARIGQSELATRLLDLLKEQGVVGQGGPSDWLASAGTEVSRRVVAVAGGIARNGFKFSVAMLSLYAFYRSGERLIELGRRLAPLLFPTAPAQFLESIGESVRAVMFGLIGTAMAQGLLTGVALAVAGVPSPVALGCLAAFISVLPGGGGAVTLAAAGWLLLEDRIPAAIGLALFGVLVVSSMDNLLRPLLISGQARISFLVVFFGVLGGLGALGLIGAFVGPVILSVAFTLVNEFSHLGGKAFPAAAAQAPD